MWGCVTVNGASVPWTIDIICQTLRKNNVLCEYKKADIKEFLKLFCIRLILCVDICEYDVCVCSDSQLWLLGETLNVTFHKFQRAERFVWSPESSDRLWGLPRLLIDVNPASLFRGEATGPFDWHSPSFGGHVKNACISTRTHAFISWRLMTHRDRYTLTRQYECRFVSVAAWRRHG